MLEVSGLCSNYGPIAAIRDVDICVPEGALVALIGSNGAGKSTTLNTVAGLKRPKAGTVELDGRRVTGVTADRLVRQGLTLVPEGRMVAASLSVAENLLLSEFAGRTTLVRRRELRDWVLTLFPVLGDRLTQTAGSLSGGQQQMLALSRALMTDPRAMLLDEPALGLAPTVIDLVYQAILEIHRNGVSILLVEQNAMLALRISTYAYVLQRGEIVMHGEPDAIRGTHEVIDAYLA
jgi:branched-chain amino acid transport system ATP-binding protein